MNDQQLATEIKYTTMAIETLKKELAEREAKLLELENELLRRDSAELEDAVYNHLSAETYASKLAGDPGATDQAYEMALLLADRAELRLLKLTKAFNEKY